MKGVILVNPHAGGGNDVDELREQFESCDVVACEPDDLDAKVHEAIKDNRDFIGVAGGDGSIRGAAEVLVTEGSSIPLLAVPGGTRNHFAHDLGIDDVDSAAEVARHGIKQQIDVGFVNDEVFVNNSSIGVYPRLVAHREVRESDLPKGIAAIVAAWHQLRRGRKVRVKVDDTPEKAWAVFVGNNCYGDSLRDLSGRERLDEGMLDVRIARADARLSRLRIVGAVLFGRTEKTPLIDRMTCATVTLDLSAKSLRVALDGEVKEMTSPLRYESKPGALTVLVSDSRP